MTSEEPSIHIQDREEVLKTETGIRWRDGKKPDYSRTNRVLHAQTRHNHPKGSLEDIVQNLVRTFEMEATYKLDPSQWHSIVQDEFKVITNNIKEYSAEDIVKHGTYNAFLGESEIYSPQAEDFESSHTLFRSTFPTGFVWEVVEVYTGPPRAVFKWRHWGSFEGNYKDYQATEKIVELVGTTVADVTEDLKIRRLEHFFDANQFLRELVAGGKCPLARIE